MATAKYRICEKDYSNTAFLHNIFMNSLYVVLHTYFTLQVWGESHEVNEWMNEVKEIK